MNQKVLLIIGSAKKASSTSESIGTYLLEQLKAKGFETEHLFCHRVYLKDRTCKELLAAVADADIIVLASPLYVDSLPSMVIRCLELIAKERKSKAVTKLQRLVAILNCGFPESHHNNTAISICRCFAKEAKVEWAGGLALGGGEAINGKPLFKVKGMARNVIKSLELSALALAEGKSIPAEAIDLMAKPLIPGRLYTLIGNIGWRRRAKKHNGSKHLHDQPYTAENQ